MNYPTHPQLEIIFAMADGLAGAAIQLARIAEKQIVRKRRRYGTTLRPGLDTPLWNALAAAIRPYLQARGEKAQLARLMMVHPSRIHEYFGRRSAMPDAERTLALIQWLSLRRAGQRPG